MEKNHQKVIFACIGLIMMTLNATAQNVPITFEPGGFGSTWTWNTFENGPNTPIALVANPNTTGINTSATVAQITALQIGMPWVGFENIHPGSAVPGPSPLGTFTLDATNSTVKVMVYKSVISDVGIKFATASNASTGEIKVPNTLINQWEELTFNFAGIIGLPSSTGIDQVIVFPDFQLSPLRSSDNICYIDNISFSAGTTTLPVNVTFQVQNPDSTPVYVFGSWSGWGNWPGDMMTDANADGIYDVTLPLLPSSTYEYLYVNGASPTKEVLNPAWPCTNGNATYTNRVLNLGAASISLCNKWASCDTCGSVTTPPINVTFKVANTDSTPVYVFGDWSGWSNWPGTPMTLNTSTGEYEATISMPGNDTIEYLFVNGVGPTKEVLNPSWPCTNGDPVYTNRKTALASSDTAFCVQWETCNACGPTSVGQWEEDPISLSISTNFINILTSKNSTVDEVEIYDIVGREVFRASGNIQTNTNIPVHLQNATMYFFRIKSGNHYFKIKGMIK